MRLDRVIAVRTDRTVYRDGDDCIKVFDRDHSKADIFQEALNQARMEEAGLNVPRVIRVDTYGGRWAIVSRYIRGRTLSQLMAENPEKMPGYLDLLVDIQRDIHMRQCPALSRMKDEISGRIDRAQLSAGARYALHTRLEGMSRESKICHGDFEPSNIVIAADGAACILDWSCVTQGDVSADAARTYLFFLMEGDESSAEEYLRLFCLKSNIAKQRVLGWLPLVAAARSVNGNAREREFLLSCVDL
jgi:aminoglycoside phosphotransferase (APT) family kinase protein